MGLHSKKILTSFNNEKVLTKIYFLSIINRRVNEPADVLTE